MYALKEISNPVLVPGFCFFLLMGCTMENSSATPSADFASLKAIVRIDVPASRCLWEIVSTPENTGGVPGPTDFMTLVAQLQLQDPKSYVSKLAPADEIFVVPNAAREWLSPAFKHLLALRSNTTSEFSTANGCHRYDTTVTKSGRKVSGIICYGEETVLLYVPLLQPKLGN